MKDNKAQMSRRVLVFSDGNEIHQTGTQEHAEMIARAYIGHRDITYTVKPGRRRYRGQAS